jgi:hypothetical protein
MYWVAVAHPRMNGQVECANTWNIEQLRHFYP